MASASEDPEVRELTSAVRELVSMTYRLSRSIHDTMDDLQDFTERRDHERRVALPWTGEERRRRER